MGLISLGKTNTPEFGLLGVTESLLLGPARNPWNFNHSPGGSSGGSAAAVASGMVSIASASDGGGSIRVPASCCGIVGLKPTIHRTIDDAQPNRPVDLSVRFVHTRSVRDAITALHHMQSLNNSKLKPVPENIYPKEKQFRIGMITSNMLGQEAEPEVRNAIENSALICQNLGHQVEEIKPFINGDRFTNSFLTMWAYGAKGIIDLAQQNFVSKETPIDSLLEPWTLDLGKWFDNQPKGQVELAVSRLKDDTMRTRELFKSFDFILSPVTQTVAPRIGSMAPNIDFDTLLESSLSFITFTPLANVTGDPAISLPMHWSSSGLPIGTHLHANYGNEEELLELSLQLEEAAPWSGRWPMI
jgi:amidase